MSNNYLKPVKENVFTKIVCFIKKLFFKEKENAIDLKEEIDIDRSVEEIEKIEPIEVKKEEDYKARYIDLYNKIRKNEVSIYSLNFEELFVLNQMADSEIDVLNQRIASIQSSS